MPKDYAHRARTNSRSKSTKTKKKTSRPRATPARKMVFHGPSFSFGALVGAAVIIAAAYAPELLQPRPQATPAPEPTAAAPQVEFEFDKLLRDSEVKADPEPYAVPEPDLTDTPSSFSVQAASFRSAADAEQLRARLLLQNLPATVSESTLDTSRWYRVTVGPFQRQVEAERALTKLREQGLDAIFLRR